MKQEVRILTRNAQVAFMRESRFFFIFIFTLFHIPFIWFIGGISTLAEHAHLVWYCS